MKMAEELLSKMPSRTRMDLRARAIFAIAFLGALRVNTLVSLRICHLDIERKRIVQDASVVRAKNGKSLVIGWFPIPEVFSKTIIKWVWMLEDEGFNERDALFPSSSWLNGSKKPRVKNRPPIPPMSTGYAVTEAFSIACRNCASSFTPHSARHTLSAERDLLELTEMQRRAFSENMGHAGEVTTIHYGRLSDDERVEVIESISENKGVSLETIPDEIKLEIFDRFYESVTQFAGMDRLK